MPTNKRLTNLTSYQSILPYASEMFGVYQPLLGWKSKRILDKMAKGFLFDNGFRYNNLVRRFKGEADFQFNQDHHLDAARVEIGSLKRFNLRPQNDSKLLQAIADGIQQKAVAPQGERWAEVINEGSLREMLSTKVFLAYKQYYDSHWSGNTFEIENNRIVQGVTAESAIAGVLMGYIKHQEYAKLDALFLLSKTNPDAEDPFATVKDDFKDPYLTFDPKKDIKDVSLSPVGIVHLYRQFFFELDTFLGTPVSHVWLSPGSTVELIETSTRRSLVEKITETSLESTFKTEKSETEEDEFSEAVKRDNKQDMKLGFSTTVNQSWGTGNASATGSLNMDTTQQEARDRTDKRMKQQSSKLSTEIRQNFKSTLKTITETTDTSSKRYVISNTSLELINYELRRKMRQVGVQIQDIGSYLCWETFVDDPGQQLGLPNLVHIAQPADLILVPNPKELPMPPTSLDIGFNGEMEWFFPENQRQNNGPDGFYKMNTINRPPIPDGYIVANPGSVIPLSQEVILMEDDDSEFFKNIAAKGKITPDGQFIEVGLILGPGGLAWDEGRIRCKVSGTVACKLNPAKEKEIRDANAALWSAKVAADNENQRKQEEAFRKTAQERITLASKIKKRKFEDLREEERTIVYRNLIKSLMTGSYYTSLPDYQTGFTTQHVLSELINSIFDIDKMLYFVAPEWWRPRAYDHSLSFGNSSVTNSINGSIVNWPDKPLVSKSARPGGYFITENSDPAPLGSSLGWLLQLDGDDLRNTFLNAPWVKAVIPIRPGKELAAMNWLQNVNVEGSDGLDAAYAATADELNEIRTTLLANDPADPVKSHPKVTINDAIRKLCLDVAKKAEAAKKVSKYPKDELIDDNKVLATPLEKVYEHGFYPLKGGFKAIVEDDFEIISQWIEVLPTDQIVPVEVKYDPKTGRQI